MPRVGIRAYICVIYHYNFDSRHKKKIMTNKQDSVLAWFNIR